MNVHELKEREGVYVPEVDLAIELGSDRDVSPDHDDFDDSGTRKPQHSRIHSRGEVRDHGQKNHGFVCDGCGARDFEGIRYKCMMCRPSYDVCSSCVTLMRDGKPLPVSYPRARAARVRVRPGAFSCL
jgi:hypothetical protein